MEHTVGPSSLEALLEEYKIQPNIRWMKLNINDVPPQGDIFVVVLFNDGTVTAKFARDINWLGAIAFGYISY